MAVSSSISILEAFVFRKCCKGGVRGWGASLLYHLEKIESVGEFVEASCVLQRRQCGMSLYSNKTRFYLCKRASDGSFVAPGVIMSAQNCLGDGMGTEAYPDRLQTQSQVGEAI